MAAESERRVVVGRIAALYGVQGWTRILSFTRPRERLLEYRPWEIERAGRWQPVVLDAAKIHGDGIIARFEGRGDRDSARVLLGCEIAVARGCLPPPAAGEYYWVDLIGLEARNRDGEMLGTVDRIIETGANDVLVVRGADTEELVPFVFGTYVCEVDLDRRQLVLDWTPGSGQ
jgi:16S rRNA processing protein RimM